MIGAARTSRARLSSASHVYTRLLLLELLKFFLLYFFSAVLHNFLLSPPTSPSLSSAAHTRTNTRVEARIETHARGGTVDEGENTENKRG